MTRILKPRTTSDGFTIIELLVVIAIIGLLSVIAAPLLLGAREKARVAGCMENLGALAPELQVQLDTRVGEGDPNAAERVIDDIITGHAVPVSHNPRVIGDDAFVDANACGGSVPTPETSCQVFLCFDGSESVVHMQYESGELRTFRLTVR